MSENTQEMFEKLFRGQLNAEEARDFLVEMYKRGESAKEIAIATKVMRDHSIKLDIDENLKNELIDIVGTGGDKSGSFNISSTTALVLASLGSKVAKHGNRAITSNSGSADMLEALGINLNLTPDKQAKMLKECGFTFLFAQNHHPSMKYIMPVRKSLSHRTIFNILGPLTNPAGAKKYLMGVFDKDFLKRIVEALSLLDTKSAFVVSSRDGMDEISISDITYAYRLKGDETQELIIDPREYGMKLYDFDAIKGGDAKENAKITESILKGEEEGAKMDVVLLNSAVALVVEDKARDIKEGIEMAKDAIFSKKAQKKLEEIIKVSKSI